MKIKPHEFVLALMEGFGGQIAGRTLLQKRAYLVAVLMGRDEPDGLGYEAYYYGPYSETIASTMGALKSVGLVREEAHSYGPDPSGGFEVKRYDYGLTEDGKKVLAGIKRANQEEYSQVLTLCARVTKSKELTYVGLSIAAKIVYLLLKEGRPLTLEAIPERARGFTWTLPQDQVNVAVKFLENLGLVTQSDTEKGG